MVQSLLKPDLHMQTLSADFWISPSKLKQNLVSMLWLLRFSKICELFTDSGLILALILLEILKILCQPTKLACVNPVSAVLRLQLRLSRKVKFPFAIVICLKEWVPTPFHLPKLKGRPLIWRALSRMRSTIFQSLNWFCLHLLPSPLPPLISRCQLYITMTTLYYWLSNPLW